MFKDSNKTTATHQQFIKKICETGVVWSLENKEGLATSSSTNYVDKKGVALGLICFWSDKTLAETNIIDDWDDYKPTKIVLSDFIENWCMGMSNDGMIVGANFDEDMFGDEIDPLELIIDLDKELKNQKKEITLKKFDHINSLVNEIERLG